MGTRRLSGWARAGLTLLTVLVGLPLIAVGGFAYWLHRQSTPPDVRAVAHSAAVDQAGRRAADVVDPRLLTAVGPAPWLVPVSDGFEDVCSTESGTFFGSGYQPVRCIRTAKQVLAADGEIAGRSKQWDRALRGQGWIRENEATDPHVAMRYIDADGVRLTVEWVESPMDDIPGVSPRFRDRGTEVYRAEKALDEADVRAAQSRFRYLALVTASLTYHDAAPPSPSPTARERSCPESDAFRCPGG